MVRLPAIYRTKDIIREARILLLEAKSLESIRERDDYDEKKWVSLKNYKKLKDELAEYRNKLKEVFDDFFPNNVPMTQSDCDSFKEQLLNQINKKLRKMEDE